MRRTRVNELFGIEHPIVQAGMIWVSGAKLAAAAAEAGALGLIGAGSMTPELLRAQIRKARTLTARPFGVNLPIFHRYAEEMVPIILEEGVRIVFTSAGSPKKYTPTFKAAGIVVAHVVSTPELAKKCEDAGVDAVVAEGFEAGGHNGRDELTTMVLVPQAVDAVKLPVIAAGGIGDGRAMAAAFALGAEGVQVGSRFVCAAESSAHAAFKAKVVEAGSTDTFLVLKPIVPVRLIKNSFCRRVLDIEAAGADKEKLSELLGRGRARLGMLDGDVEEGELEIGQVSGLIRDVAPAAEIVRRLVEECRAAIASLS
ncbi:MAG: nitronate monooxygenase [Myxococcales bacterium]|nr:MAG: nitronate monooxygenase [Myxococcales bacterium]